MLLTIKASKMLALLNINDKSEQDALNDKSEQDALNDKSEQDARTTYY
jgi:hypothetical protein